MPWGDAEWRDPWLPSGENTRTVADQRDDSSSVLNFCRDLLQLRRNRNDLAHGGYERLDAQPGVWAWRRGAGTVVAINLTGADAPLEIAGHLLLSTSRREDASSLAPWEGIVLEV